MSGKLPLVGGYGFGGAGVVLFLVAGIARSMIKRLIRMIAIVLLLAGGVLVYVTRFK